MRVFLCITFIEGSLDVVECVKNQLPIAAHGGKFLYRQVSPVFHVLPIAGWRPADGVYWAVVRGLDLFGLPAIAGLRQDW